MQTFPNTKNMPRSAWKQFAQKIKNSSPCAAARSGTQSFKNQATKKRRAHTIVCMPNEFSALHSKTNTVTTWKNGLSRVFIGHWSKLRNPSSPECRTTQNGPVHNTREVWACPQAQTRRALAPLVFFSNSKYSRRYRLHKITKVARNLFFFGKPENLLVFRSDMTGTSELLISIAILVLSNSKEW